jgi:hypothetical protein
VATIDVAAATTLEEQHPVNVRLLELELER